MIVGIGTDIVDIRRIERLIAQHGQRFKERVFTPHERRHCEDRKDDTAAYARRFAAKEAFVKALGSGFRDGISWQDMGVVNDDAGRPAMWLSEAMRERLFHRFSAREPQCHVSLSDEPPYAVAFVIISL